jgi:ADP-ribose pyrophosphatase YjhB (NUDIX family)
MTRGMTLGVRAVVTDADGAVLLIEHTYVPGWHLPGGGVDRGETAEAAVGRELLEEAGVRALGRPRLVSIHDNGARFRGDHILLYRVNEWEPATATSRGEIHRVGFFPRRQLPEGATAGTRRRLAEVFGGAAADPRW